MVMTKKQNGSRTKTAASNREKVMPARKASSPAPAIEATESAVSNQDTLSLAVSKRERIALLAYAYWEERGCQGGSPEEDWFRAEKEIILGQPI
jgi:hypothetical protein